MCAEVSVRQREKVVSEGEMTLVDELLIVRADIVDAAPEIPAAQRNTPFVGHWAIRDLLAHLAGWDYTTIDAVADALAGVLRRVRPRLGVLQPEVDRQVRVERMGRAPELVA
jgi:hypothetical protein